MPENEPPSGEIITTDKEAKAQLSVTGVNTASPAPLEPAGFRIVLVSFLGGAIGLIAGCIAFLLYKLIGLFTNIAFYGHFSAAFLSARHNHLGLWVIPIPVIGGLIVGIMAKYGSPKIKGHGIPEAMEAVLVNRSRIQPRVAILKPISAAIAIGTGGPFGAEGPIIQTGGAEGAAGLWCGGRDVGDFQYAYRRSDSGDRVAAVRIPIAVIYSTGDRQHSGHGSSHAIAGRGADVQCDRFEFRCAARAAVLLAAGRDLRAGGSRLHAAALLDGRPV